MRLCYAVQFTELLIGIAVALAGFSGVVVVFAHRSVYCLILAEIANALLYGAFAPVLAAFVAILRAQPYNLSA